MDINPTMKISDEELADAVSALSAMSAGLKLPSDGKGKYLGDGIVRKEAPLRSITLLVAMLELQAFRASARKEERILSETLPMKCPKCGCPHWDISGLRTADSPVSRKGADGVWRMGHALEETRRSCAAGCGWSQKIVKRFGQIESVTNPPSFPDTQPDSGEHL